MSEPTQHLWNSLEVVKLVVGGLTPLTVVAVGFWISRALKRIEHLQWANQKAIERRLKVFDELAPLLNDLLCYMTYIGSWQEQTPDQIVSLKRKMDKIAYVNATLFPPAFLDEYNAFIGDCFSTYTGWGNAAKIRSLLQRRKDAAGKKWEDEWDEFFDTQTPPEVEEVRRAYSSVMNAMTSELGINLHQHLVQCGLAPGNIR